MAEPSRASPAGKSLLHRGADLYRNLNKLDRWSGGGFGLSTVVKLAGWAGLIAVVAALVIRIRGIEDQLDPVSHGVERLQREVDLARAAVRADTERSRAELTDITRQEHELRGALAHQLAVEARAEEHLAAAAEEGDALAKRLELTTQRAESIDGTGAQAQKALELLVRSVEGERAALDSKVSSVSGSSQALGDAVKRIEERSTQLDQDVHALSLDSTRALLKRVDQDALSLAEALEKATARVKMVDAVLSRPLDGTSPRPGELRSGSAAASSAAPAASEVDASTLLAGSSRSR